MGKQLNCPQYKTIIDVRGLLWPHGELLCHYKIGPKMDKKNYFSFFQTLPFSTVLSFSPLVLQFDYTDYSD
jgi:hypothetical protein